MQGQSISRTGAPHSSSIGAFESVCRLMMKDRNAELGQRFKKIDLHPDLRKGFSGLYGSLAKPNGSQVRKV